MTDKVAIITGASRGIGAEVAQLAAARGYVVIVNYAQNEQAAQEVVAAISSAGGQAFALQGDVQLEDDVMRLFAFAQSKGSVEVLINNAGIVDYPQRLDEMSIARLQRMFSVNLIGAFLCAREAVKLMSTRHGGQGGSIVNVSSAAAKLGSAGQYIDYAASKGAIDTMTIGLAHEVAEENIRVNAVRPGIIDTDIHASGGQPDRAQALKDQIPLQRPGTAREVANAIMWLVSNEASYSTGSIIDVSGGRSVMP